MEPPRSGGHPRLRRAPARARDRDGARRRREPRAAPRALAGRHAVCGDPAIFDQRARRDGRRARERRHPSRSEARQHPRVGRGASAAVQDRRLRHREGARGHDVHGERCAARDVHVHGARAGEDAERHRPSRGHLFARRHALRARDGAAAVRRRRESLRGDDGPRHESPSISAQVARGRTARPRATRPRRAREGPRAAAAVAARSSANGCSRRSRASTTRRRRVPMRRRCPKPDATPTVTR